MSYSLICVVCNNPFEGRVERQNVCSKECRKNRRRSRHYETTKEWIDAYKNKYGKSYSAEWRAARSDKQRAHTSEVYKKWHYLNKYGINSSEYESMYSKQEGVCAICGLPQMSPRYKRLSVDHDHETGEVRGLLCNKCNSGLGAFQDSLDVLRAAVRYLEESQTINEA